MAETSGNLETVKVGRTNRLGINLVIIHGRVKKVLAQADINLVAVKVGADKQTWN